MYTRTYAKAEVLGSFPTSTITEIKQQYGQFIYWCLELGLSEQIQFLITESFLE